MLCVALVQDSSHRQKLLKLGINAIEHLMPPAFYTALNRVDEAALQTVLMLADAGDDDAGWAARAQMVREGWKRRVNYRLEESFRWGCVSFKGTKKTLAGGEVRLGYQCDCPRRSHTQQLASGGITRCQWTMTYSDGESRLYALRQLKWWVSQAWSCKTKAKHQALRKKVPGPEELPSMESLDASKPDEDRALTEDEAEAVEPPPAKRARGRGRGHGSSVAACSKVGAKAKVKAKGKATARGRGRGSARAPPDEAGSDSPGPGNADSSSSESDEASVQSSSSDSSSSSSTNS